MGLSVQSSSIRDGQPIPERHAMGVAHPALHATATGGNVSPHLRWSGVPAGTRSFAILAVDPDVAVDMSNAGVEGTTILAGADRRDFAHWVVVDVPADVTEIVEGADSDRVTVRGKPSGATTFGGVAGRNDFTDFFAGDPAMGGTYCRYDGPYPPWNDERLHHYVFTVLALDVPSLGLSGDFGLTEARQAMQGHVLDSASLTGTYTLNPVLRAVS